VVFIREHAHKSLGDWMHFDRPAATARHSTAAKTNPSPLLFRPKRVIVGVDLGGILHLLWNGNFP
jgi:hypothetical protein